MNVTVADNTAPVITASFIDNRSCAESSSIDTIKARLSVLVGVQLKIQGDLCKVELHTSVLEMLVTATDVSNSLLQEKKILTIAR